MTQLFTRDKSGKVVPLIEDATPTGKPVTEYKDEKGRTIVHMAFAADGSLIPYEEALKLEIGYDSQGHAFRRSDDRHIPTECRGIAQKHHFPAIRTHMSDSAQKAYTELESGAGSVVV
jgi:hypothetical protein